MSEKYSQYGKQYHYTASGPVSGKYEADYEYLKGKDYRPMVWGLFLFMAISALFGIDYADMIINAIDFIAYGFASLVR
jgi:hypothetical protein